MPPGPRLASAPLWATPRLSEVSLLPVAVPARRGLSSPGLGLTLRARHLLFHFSDRVLMSPLLFSLSLGFILFKNVSFIIILMPSEEGEEENLFVVQ